MKNPPRTKSVGAPRWSNLAVINAAQRLTTEYESIVGREFLKKNGLHFDDFYERLIFPKFKISLYEDDDLGADNEGRKLLGRYDVLGNAAHLDRVISRESKDPRRTFTCWHEVAGHGALQGTWLRKQLEATPDSAFIDVTEYSLQPHAERILERQANLFASHLAAPDWLINYAIETTFRTKNRFVFREPCIYWLDVHGLRTRRYVTDVDDLCGWIGSKISGFFGGLSGQAIGYRIAKIGWVNHLRGPDFRLHRATQRHSMSGNLMSEYANLVQDPFRTPQASDDRVTVCS